MFTSSDSEAETLLLFYYPSSRQSPKGMHESVHRAIQPNHVLDACGPQVSYRIHCRPVVESLKMERRISTELSPKAGSKMEETIVQSTMNGRKTVTR